jgi:hypothetical protein
MRHSHRVLVLVASLMLTSACASSRATTTEAAPRGDQSILTADQLNAQIYQTAYDAIEALRTNWLRPRGPDSFRNPSTVVVYLDNEKLGGVEMLRGVQLLNVLVIRHYDAASANARWGVGHASGVIQILTMASGGVTAPDDAR